MAVHLRNHVSHALHFTRWTLLVFYQAMNTHASQYRTRLPAVIPMRADEIFGSHIARSLRSDTAELA
jgi:hypothetical protein